MAGHPGVCAFLAPPNSQFHFTPGRAKMTTKSASVETVTDEFRDPANLRPYPRNARLHSDEQVTQLAASFEEFGFIGFCLIDEDDEIIAGHGRQLAALRIGLSSIPVKVARGWSKAKRRRFRLLDNKVAENSTWDEALLGIELGDMRDEGDSIEGLGWASAALDELLAAGLPGGEGENAGEAASRAGNLAARFGVPPFSVLNARDGWWQDRKRAWLALGIQSELGRGSNALDMSASMAGLTDPAEIEAWNERRRAASKANAVPGGQPMPLDRKKARTFGQDMLEGEGSVPLRKGVRQSTARGRKGATDTRASK